MKNREGKDLVPVHMPRETEARESDCRGRATASPVLSGEASPDVAAPLVIEQEAMKSLTAENLEECLLDKVRTDTGLPHPPRPSLPSSPPSPHQS